MPESVVKPTAAKESLAKKEDPGFVNNQPLDIKMKPVQSILPNVWRLAATSLRLLWKYKQVFIGIVLVFGLVNFALAQGFSSGTNAASIKNSLGSLFQGQYRQVYSGLAVFAVMLTSIGSSNNGAGGFGYEFIILILASLALIWTIRNSFNNTTVRVRDAYYQGMYPLIPFILILIVIGIELLPMIVGLSIYIVVANNHIAINLIEQSLFVIIALVLTGLTLYLISSSMFALYIVTLPEMTPLKALRSAKDLVHNRRFPILLRFLFLPVAMLVAVALIMLPVIIIAAPLASWVLLFINLLLLPLFHSYMYSFYRELLA